MQSRKILFLVIALILFALGIVMLAIPPIHGGDDRTAPGDNDSGKKVMSMAIEQVRAFGIDLTDEKLKEMENELKRDVSALSVTDILLWLGMGKYDYDTDQWTPRSNRVYAFDAEIYNVGKMYTLFLQGVQAIVPDIKITDICEDLSKMTDEIGFLEDPDLPPVDGKRSVSFVCNNHPYSTELDSFGDWFNPEMFAFMDHVLEKEGYPLKLYQFSANIQYVIMVYCSDSEAEELAPLIDIFGSNDGETLEELMERYFGK